jgi:hypothetical protein
MFTLPFSPFLKSDLSLNRSEFLESYASSGSSSLWQGICYPLYIVFKQDVKWLLHP